LNYWDSVRESRVPNPRTPPVISNLRMQYQATAVLLVTTGRPRACSSGLTASAVLTVVQLKT
jgi:hypothetical protein